VSTNDEATRNARAKRLREELDQFLGRGDKTTSPPTNPSPTVPESPRDFIHRRMHELDKKKPSAKDD
jgi:hypothetical protein